MPNVVEILITATNEAGKAFAETEASGSKLGQSLQKMGLVAGIAVGAIAVKSVEMAATFDSAVTNLNTSGGELQSNLKSDGDAMLKMSGDVGVSATDLAKAMWSVTSVGYQGAAGIKVLGAAAQGAAAEHADLGKVINGVTSYMVDYHLKAGQAATATSQMIAAVGFGGTSFENFSGSLSRVLPLASALGLSFKDVSGVMAEQTAHEISAKQAAVNTADAIKALNKATKQQSTEFKVLGTNADEVRTRLGTNGLSATMEWLSGLAAKGSKSHMDYVNAMQKVMSNAPALQAALATTGENYKATSNAIKGIGSATADAQGNVKGFAEVQKTFAQQWADLRAKVDAFMIELGQKLIPVLQNMFGFIDAHSDTFSKIAIGLGIFTAALITYSVATKIATVATDLFTGALEINPFGAIVVGIIALVAGILYLWNHFEGFRNFWKAAWADAKVVFAVAWADIKAVAEKVWGWLQPIFAAITKIGKQVVSDIEEWWKSHGEEVITIAKATWEVIKVAVQIYWNSIVGILKTAWEIIKMLFDTFVPPLIAIVKGAWTMIEGAARLSWAIVSNVIKIAFDTIMVIVNVALDLLTGHWSKAWTDIKNYLSQVWDAIKSLVSSGLSAVGTILSGAVTYLGGIWGAITGILTAPFKAAWSIITGIVNNILGAIASIPGGQSVLNFIGLGGHAHGGIVGAASGGARSGLTMVGEHGAELVRLGAGSRVYSNPDTEAMLSGGGGSGGGVATIIIQSDGTDYGEFLAQELKRLARIRGNGNLQLAIVGRTV